MKFEVEGTFVVKSRFQAMVLVRQVTPGDWTLSPTSTLDGIAIEKWTDIPRALDANGKQRFDIFAFCLCDPAQISHFSHGQMLELKM